MTNYKLGKKPARRDKIRVPLTWEQFIQRNSPAVLGWLEAEAQKLSVQEAAINANPPAPAPAPSPSPAPAPAPIPAPVLTVPAVFGPSELPSAWDMLGNDVCGDCVIAGAMHETILWTLDGDGEDAQFDTDEAVAVYSAWTGYNPNDVQPDGSNPTDQGTDMVAAARLRQSQGITDSAGTDHKIVAYIALDYGNTQQLAEAAYALGVAAVGVVFPQQWMTAFDNGQPWDQIPDVTRDDIIGGHYVPVIGRNEKGNFVCVTWGKTQEITPAGYAQFNDETLAYVTSDYLTGDKQTKLNFDMAKLQQLLAEFQGQAASQGSTGITN